MQQNMLDLLSTQDYPAESQQDVWRHLNSVANFVHNINLANQCAVVAVMVIPRNIMVQL